MNELQSQWENPNNVNITKKTMAGFRKILNSVKMQSQKSFMFNDDSVFSLEGSLDRITFQFYQINPKIT